MLIFKTDDVNCRVHSYIHYNNSSAFWFHSVNWNYSSVLTLHSPAITYVTETNCLNTAEGSPVDQALSTVENDWWRRRIADPKLTEVFVEYVENS